MKNCKKCNIDKELDQFSKKLSAKDGLQNYCKSCNSEVNKDYNKDYHKAYYKDYNKDYYGTENYKLSRDRWKYKIPPAVYELRNTLTNRVYIGQSIEPNQRIQNHFSRLRGGYHDNPNLQADFNLYGESVFVSNIVENCEPIDLKRQEAKHIKRNRKTVYNIQKV